MNPNYLSTRNSKTSFKDSYNTDADRDRRFNDISRSIVLAKDRLFGSKCETPRRNDRNTAQGMNLSGIYPIFQIDDRRSKILNIYQLLSPSKLQTSPSPSSSGGINLELNVRKYSSASTVNLHQTQYSIKPKTKSNLIAVKGKDESMTTSKLFVMNEALNKGINNLQFKSRSNLHNSVDLKVSRVSQAKQIILQPETGSASSQQKETLPVSPKDLKFTRSPSAQTIATSQVEGSHIIEKLNKTKQKLTEGGINPILKRLSSHTSKQSDLQKEELAEFKPTFHSRLEQLF